MAGLEDKLPETQASKDASKEAFENAHWTTDHIAELREKYKGKWIAVINKQVIAADSEAEKAYDAARKQYPSKVPVIYFVSRKDYFGIGHNIT